MARFTIILALVCLVLLQDVLVSGWWRRRRRRSPRTCSYPRPSQTRYSHSKNDYFYGSTKLSIFGKKRIVNTWSLKHSLLLFRGKIYEWDRASTPKTGRNPSSCKISWTFARKSWSKCKTSDINKWNNNYRRRYGSYKLFSNNCHHYVNRLARKLYGDCGRR